MSLDSNSSITEIEAAYLDNMSYGEDGSVSKARAFVTACRALLLKLPKLQREQGDELQLNPEMIRDELVRAQAWVEAHAEEDSEMGPRVIKGGLREFRS